MADKKIWHPPDYEKADVRAIQSLALYAMGAERPWPEGEEPPVPTPLDVKRALDWIVHRACATYESGFVADDPNGRIAAFMDGRQFAGMQIVKLMKLRPEVVSK